MAAQTLSAVGSRTPSAGDDTTPRRNSSPNTSTPCGRRAALGALEPAEAEAEAEAVPRGPGVGLTSGAGPCGSGSSP